MAIFPCVIGDHRYPGAQQTIYPAVGAGSTWWRTRLRLCPRHFEAYHEVLDDTASNDQLEFNDDRISRCGLCRNAVTDSEWMFFATVYATRKERVDWWAPLHSACVQAMAQDWRLAAEMAQNGPEKP